MPSTLAAVRRDLAAAASPARAKANAWFFKTKPGQYVHCDRFRGLTVPQIRLIANRYRDLPMGGVQALLRSRYHEDRLLAVLLLVDRFRNGAFPERRQIYRLYVSSTRYINNWDLVDASAGTIVGGFLEHGPRRPLDRFAKSNDLWLRRIAIIATFPYIMTGESATTYRIADALINDEHDLIHKAVGWMLRETGKRCSVVGLKRYLKPRYKNMPRTMLRYAIEKFPERRRRAYLRGDV